MQPTSKFGELFQYSNPMAGAAGFTGGHVLYPDMELGAAYDKAMQTQVFDPLGMKSTTFDYAKAQAGDHAAPHAPTIDGKPALAVMEANYSIIPLRPAGAAWSNVNDMLRYVSMELANGKLPDGKAYIPKEPLLERRAPQVAIGKDETYGMGLMVDTEYDIPVVHHGGDMIGYHSDMIWLPDSNVGAVILTNADPGWILRSQFRRRLLEVLFDGKPEAAAQVAAAGKSFYSQIAAERKLLTVPADPAESAKLAPLYANAALGEIAVSRANGTTLFDFGEWRSDVASKKESRRHDLVRHDRAGHLGLRVRRGRGAEEDARDTRRAARVRVRGEVDESAFISVATDGAEKVRNPYAAAGPGRIVLLRLP